MYFVVSSTYQRERKREQNKVMSKRVREKDRAGGFILRSRNERETWVMAMASMRETEI